MPHQIILLTGVREAPYLLDFAKSLNAAVDVVAVTSKHQFRTVMDGPLSKTRLISFFSPIIVPAEVIDRLTLTPYNIHPGPPERPGLFPEAFAVSEGATEFGVTLHEMTAEIDAGPIVEVLRFKIDQHATRLDVLDRAERHAVQLFVGLARHCAHNDTALPLSNELWSGQRTTSQDYEQLVSQRADLKVPDEDALIQSLRA